MFGGGHLVLGGRLELPLLVLAYGHAATGDHDGLTRLIDVGNGEAEGEAVDGLHPQRERRVDERRVLARPVVTDRVVDGTRQRPERLVLRRRWWNTRQQQSRADRRAGVAHPSSSR